MVLQTRADALHVGDDADPVLPRFHDRRLTVSEAALIAGLVGYAFTWTAVRGALTVVMAVLLGVRLSAAHSGFALLILALIVAAYFAIGLMAAAMVLAFRTTGPLPQVVLLLSGLLGGVYYPTSVIPSWIQSLSSVVPHTKGMRALRRVVIQGG